MQDWVQLERGETDEYALVVRIVRLPYRLQLFRVTGRTIRGASFRNAPPQNLKDSSYQHRRSRRTAGDISVDRNDGIHRTHDCVAARKDLTCTCSPAA